MTDDGPDRGDPYAGIAELYDLEHRDYGDDLGLYFDLARVVGDPILELGCGTGRVLVPLAEAGYRITGLDASTPMLDRARTATEAAGVSSRVTLHAGPMAQAERAAGGPFGLAIIALNGLLHLPSAEAQRTALTAARRALDPRAQLVVDVLNPTPEALRALDSALGHEGTWRLPDGTRVDKFAARRVSPSRQRIDTELWYDRLAPDRTLHRTATSYPMRYVHRAELELMLELSGFVEWQVYGGYELEPYDDVSERLIVIAEVTPSARPDSGAQQGDDRVRVGVSRV